MNKNLQQAQAEGDAAAAAWNAAHPVGTEVIRYKLINPMREPHRTRTRSEAWVLGHGAVVVKVDGVAGGVLLESLELPPQQGVVK